MASSIGTLSYRTYTRSRLAPQSVPFADLSTLGPIIVSGVRLSFCYGLVLTKDKLCGYNPYRPCVNGVSVCRMSLTYSVYTHVLFSSITFKFKALDVQTMIGYDNKKILQNFS